MKIKILNEFSWQAYPVTNDMIGFDFCDLEQIGKSKKFDLTTNTIVDYVDLIKLRQQREIECFSFINRGKIWYDTLTADQVEELKIWYRAWLDVTATKVVPVMPKFLR